MKRIFVTVEEFINNGGSLTKDRSIWIGDLLGNISGEAGTFNRIQEGPTNFIVRLNENNEKLLIDRCFVRIEVTPIYK